MLHVTEPPSACRVRCCRPSSFSAASDSAAVSDRARSQQLVVWTVRLLPIELIFSRLASDNTTSADRARTQQLDVGQCGCCRSISFSAAWRRTVRLLPIELVRSSLGTVPLLSIELILCKHKTLCMACISRAQLSLATDHSVLGSRSSTVDFLCAEPEGALTMQSYLPHITHQHLHEPREHQQHELTPHQLAHLAQYCGRFLWPSGRTVLTYRYGAQAVYVGWERTSAIDTENKFMLNGLRWGSHNDSLYQSKL